MISKKLNPTSKHGRAGALRLPVLLCVVCTHFSVASIPSQAAFPIHEFQAFISRKPTIVRFVFSADARRFGTVPPDVEEAPIRNFQFKGDGADVFTLFEDTSAQPNNPYERGRFWVRYHNRYWHRFNTIDVMTTTWAPDDTFDHSHGPAQVASQLGLAYDALNLGIIGLDTNGVHWDGLAFAGRAADTGNDIQGILVLSDAGQPISARVTYTPRGQISGSDYVVSYDFSPTGVVPEYFPTRISIESGFEPLMRVAVYHIDELLLSERRLVFADIDPSQYLTADSRLFVQSNGVYYSSVALQGSNIFVPFGTVIPFGGDLATVRGGHGMSGNAALVRMIIGAVIIGPLIWMFLKWRSRERARK